MNVVGVLAEVVQIDLHRVPVNLSALHITLCGDIGSRILDVTRPAHCHRSVAMTLDADTTRCIVDGPEEVVGMHTVVVDAHRLYKVVLLVVAHTLHLPVGATPRVDDASVDCQRIRN